MLTAGAQVALQDHFARQLALPASTSRNPAPRRAADHDRTGPALTLAQRYGLVAAPAPKLSKDEWREVQAQSARREDERHGCPICREDFKAEDQVLLSCSHIFHKACLRSFEKFSKQRVCPICRAEEYQKKLVRDAAEKYRHRCATRIQAAYRGYRIRRWRRRMDASDAPKGLGARREFYAGRLEEANAGLLEALEETGDELDSLFAELDASLSHSRLVFSAADKQLTAHAAGGAGEAEGAVPGKRKKKAAGVDWKAVKAQSREREDSHCPICIGSLTQVTKRRRRVAWLSCSHVFHLDCIEAFEGFQESQGMACQCPVCRASGYARQPPRKPAR